MKVLDLFAGTGSATAAFVDHEATSWAEAFWVSVIVWALVGGAGVFVALVGRAVGA